MDSNEAKRQLLSAYEFYLRTGDFEGPSLSIDEVLKKFPECVDIFIEKFDYPKEKDDKEILAHIILKILHYQPAIDYMKSIGEDDFTGYARFPES
jgi:hypothetical protein